MSPSQGGTRAGRHLTFGKGGVQRCQYKDGHNFKLAQPAAYVKLSSLGAVVRAKGQLQVGAEGMRAALA